MECSVIVSHFGIICTMRFCRVFRSFASIAASPIITWLKCNRAIQTTTVSVMRALTYGFRRRLVTTVPPRLFCVHCLPSIFATYTHTIKLAAHIFVASECSVFVFTFFQIVVILLIFHVLFTFWNWCELCAIFVCLFNCWLSLPQWAYQCDSKPLENGAIYYF